VRLRSDGPSANGTTRAPVVLPILPQLVCAWPHVAPVALVERFVLPSTRFQVLPLSPVHRLRAYKSSPQKMPDANQPAFGRVEVVAVVFKYVHFLFRLFFGGCVRRKSEGQKHTV